MIYFYVFYLLVMVGRKASKLHFDTSFGRFTLSSETDQIRIQGVNFYTPPAKALRCHRKEVLHTKIVPQEL